MGAGALLRGLGFLSSLLPEFWWEYEQSLSTGDAAHAVALPGALQATRAALASIQDVKVVGIFIHSYSPGLGWHPWAGDVLQSPSPALALLSRDPGHFLQDIHGMTSPGCKVPTEGLLRAAD